MGKASKRGKAKTKAQPQNGLEGPLAAFGFGDQPLTRALIEQKLSSGELSEGEKKQAEELLAATRIERGTALVGLGALLLFLLAALIAAFMQP
jgi:hypothetical protein